MWSRTEQRDGCSKYGKEHIDLYFCKSAKQKLWVKIQHCETCKETGVGEYKCAYIFYILMDIFPFTKNLNGIDTSSEAAFILLWFVRTFCRQEEQCSVYIFSGMSDLIMDGHSTMLLPLVGETWREPLGKKKIGWIQSAAVTTSGVQWAGGREGGETVGTVLCCPFTIKEDDKVIDQCCVLRIAPTVKLQVVAQNVAGGFSAECRSRPWLDFFLRLLWMCSLR